MRMLITACTVLALATTGASAADISSDVVDYGPGPTTSSPNWAARFGIAFDGYYVDQADNDEGTGDQGATSDNKWNLGGHVDFAVGGVTAAGWGAQVDVRGSLFNDNHENDNDWTASYLTGAVHLFTQMGGGTIGAFAGGGITEDTGDSDESQTYWFAGIEGQRAMGNSIVFGQLGYLDGEDEFEEGINQAGFAQIGIRYFCRPNIAFMAAVGGAFGDQDEDSDEGAWIGDLKLEAEYAFGNGSTSLFASYEGTFVSFDGGDHNTNFHGMMIGFRWRPGASDLMSAYSGPASLEVAPVDRWFAFTANEVE